MGFGAVIASGKNNRLLSDSLMACITEARVEQFLDEPTRFAIRFEEDLSGGEPVIMKTPELQCEQMITIGVKVDEAIRCLVRGPVTDVKCSMKQGGPGSWYELHGQDRRVELDRKCVHHAWTGRASAAAETILSRTFTSDVEQTRIVYGGPRAGGGQVTQTLNQRSTDATFIRWIARDCNLHFWLEYDCQLINEMLGIKEKANLKSSPPRPRDAPAGPVPATQITLVPTVPVKLRVNVDKEQCQNVTAFDLTMNPERPNQFVGSSIDDRDVQEHRTTVTDPQPVIRRGDQRLAGCNEQRDVCITSAGNQEELQNRAESALTDAGWFVDATASTTTHMLGGILSPHDVVEVEGLGPVHSGPYQVKSVTHVINAADHFMDIQLRRNAVGGE